MWCRVSLDYVKIQVNPQRMPRHFLVKLIMMSIFILEIKENKNISKSKVTLNITYQDLNLPRGEITLSLKKISHHLKNSVIRLLSFEPIGFEAD